MVLFPQISTVATWTSTTAKTEKCGWEPPRESQGFDLEPSEQARNTLLKGAQRLMPAMADAEVVLHTACLRPLSPDWMPIVGTAPGWDNAYLATGGGKKGILLSPGLGKAVADLVTEGSTDLPVDEFTAGRFNDN